MIEDIHIQTPADNGFLNKTIAFLQEIGIVVHFRAVDENSFLPGLSIEKGEIIIDTAQLKYPGDILHEAGHIAVVAAAERHSLNAGSIAKREQREAEEMMAIAWTYAVCLHLDIDPLFAFHKGYKDGGTYIVENFQAGRYIGVPMLQWTGMALPPKATGGYPKMIRWMRE